MKYVALLIAGVALAGCDITFGSNGPVVTQTDGVISRVAPLRTRSVPQDTVTAGQVETSASQNAAAPARESRVGTGIPIMVSGVVARTALPLGVTRGNVDSFKSIVADEGCTIATREQKAAVRSRTGFDAEKLDRVIGYVWRTNELDRNSGSYTLTSGPCSDG